MLGDSCGQRQGVVVAGSDRLWQLAMINKVGDGKRWWLEMANSGVQGGQAAANSDKQWWMVWPSCDSQWRLTVAVSGRR